MKFYLSILFLVFSGLSLGQLSLVEIAKTKNLHFFAPDINLGITKNKQGNLIELGHLIDFNKEVIYEFDYGGFDLSKIIKGNDDEIEAIIMKESEVLIIRRHVYYNVIFSGKPYYFAIRYLIQGKKLVYQNDKIEKQKIKNWDQIWPSGKQMYSLSDEIGKIKNEYKTTSGKNLIITKTKTYITPDSVFTSNELGSSVDFGYGRLDFTQDKWADDVMLTYDFENENSINNAFNNKRCAVVLNGLVNKDKSGYQITTEIELSGKVSNLQKENRYYADVYFDSYMNMKAIEVYANNPFDYSNILFESEIKDMEFHDLALVQTQANDFIEVNLNKGELSKDRDEFNFEYFIRGDDFYSGKLDLSQYVYVLMKYEFDRQKEYTPLIGDPYSKDVFKCHYFLYNASNRYFDYSNYNGVIYEQRKVTIKETADGSNKIFSPGMIWYIGTSELIVSEDDEPVIPNYFSGYYLPNGTKKTIDWGYNPGFSFPKDYSFDLKKYNALEDEFEKEDNKKEELNYSSNSNFNIYSTPDSPEWTIALNSQFWKKKENQDNKEFKIENSKNDMHANFLVYDRSLTEEKYFEELKETYEFKGRYEVLEKGLKIINGKEFVFRKVRLHFTTNNYIMHSVFRKEDDKLISLIIFNNMSNGKKYDQNIKDLYTSIRKGVKPITKNASSSSLSNSYSGDLSDIEERLAKLKSLYEKGYITKEEYDNKRNEILDDFTSSSSTPSAKSNSNPFLGKWHGRDGVQMEFLSENKGIATFEDGSQNNFTYHYGESKIRITFSTGQSTEVNYTFINKDSFKFGSYVYIRK